MNRILFCISILLTSVLTYGQYKVENKVETFVAISGTIVTPAGYVAEKTVSAKINELIAAKPDYVLQNIAVSNQYGDSPVFFLTFVKTTPDPTFVNAIKAEVLKTATDVYAAKLKLAMEELDAKLILKLQSINDTCWNAELKQDVKNLVIADLKNQLEEFKKEIEAKLK